MENEVSLFGEKRMTVKEVAEAFGVTPEAIKKHVRGLFPEAMKNGIPTYLNEQQVTDIKRTMIPTTQVVAATTDFEMIEKAKDVMQWLNQKYEEEKQKRIDAENKLEISAPKAIIHDALLKTTGEMSITDASKHFGLNPKSQVFPYLREHGYLTRKDLPTQYAIELDLLTLKQNMDVYGRSHSQAVVQSRQLPRFKKLVADRMV
jgi:phage antirepressor YoqD-like protein